MNCGGFNKESPPLENSMIKKQISDFEFVLSPNKDKQIILGKGAYAEVLLIKDKYTKKLYALKTVMIFYEEKNTMKILCFFVRLINLD